MQLPIVPLFYTYIIFAVISLGRDRVWVTRGGIAAVVALGLALLLARVQNAEFRVPLDGIETTQYHDMFDYIRNQTEADSTFIFDKPRTFALYTGRRAAAIYNTRSGDGLIAYMHQIGAHYVLFYDGWYGELRARNSSPTIFGVMPTILKSCTTADITYFIRRRPRRRGHNAARTVWNDRPTLVVWQCRRLYLSLPREFLMAVRVFRFLVVGGGVTLLAYLVFIWAIWAGTGYRLANSYRLDLHSRGGGNAKSAVHISNRYGMASMVPDLHRLGRGAIGSIGARLRTAHRDTRASSDACFYCKRRRTGGNELLVFELSSRVAVRVEPNRDPAARI